MRQLFKNILLWVISLAILNTSVDVMDESAENFSINDSSSEEYNEIESLAELVMDETTDQSLPDQKGNDAQGLIKKTTSFDYTIELKRTRFFCQDYIENTVCHNGNGYTIHLSPGYRTIFTPPPNMAA